MAVKYRLAQAVQGISRVVEYVVEMLEILAPFLLIVALVDVFTIIGVFAYTGVFWASVGTVLWWNLIIFLGLLGLGLVIGGICWASYETKKWSDRYIQAWKEDEWKGRAR